jgi:methyl-accepting chemotaxis protein
MRNVTIRSNLLVVLFVFASMIVVGAIVGVLMLGRANDNARRLHQIAQQEILVNDGYKDTTRTRAALTRAYSALKERNDTATRDSALKSAQVTLDRAAAETGAFRDAPGFAGRDETLQRSLVESSNVLAALLTKAREALRIGDTTAYAAINDKEITGAGAKYSSNVEAFQNLSNSLMKDTLAQGEREHGWVITLVVIGVIGALCLIAVTHLALRRIVIDPLKRAIASLDQIAANDLTNAIPQSGRNEIGQLFDAMRRMQHGLSGTVMNVRSSCDAINTGAREIAAGNIDLSSRTEEQSASLEETAASMEELTSTVKQNADNAQQASKLAATAADVAQRGGEVVGRAVATMNAISTSSNRIAEITGMIDGIAFQTNILALNAAVESARAGEHGRGFAVVATEVRTLAQRSANAAKEIKTLIGTSVHDVQLGNGLVAQAGDTMTEIVNAVQKVASLMNEITAASIEQSAGIAQVGKAVSQMDQVTQQNAALVEQAAAAASSLEQQAKQMADAVAAFQLSE